MLVLIAEGRMFEFDLVDAGTFTIGSSPQADLCADVAALAPIHATLRGGDRTWTLQDAGSESGTFVGGADCATQRRPVHIGEPIAMGSVIGQLRWTELPYLSTRSVSPAEFDRRVRDEIERCIRFDHNLAVLLVEVDQQAVVEHPDWAEVAAGSLRAGDLITARSRRRMDVAVAECKRRGAIDIAQRVHAALAAIGVDAKLGVASYPQDVPSSENLLFAAEQAMQATAEPIGVARDGVRVMRVADRDVVIAEPAMIRLFGMIERVANAGFPVTIQGESGTGTSLVAQAIHELGRRAARPFVRLDCSEVTARELFGGGAGPLESAMHGTLFLDRVGELPQAAQVELLRVLTDGTVHNIRDVRVVAATRTPLDEAVAEGAFLRALFHRLSPIVMTLPPLRERPRTLKLLSQHYATAAARKAGREPIRIGRAALERILAHDWPENIRELRAAITAAVQRCDGNELHVAHLPDVLQRG